MPESREGMKDRSFALYGAALCCPLSGLGFRVPCSGCKIPASRSGLDSKIYPESGFVNSLEFKFALFRLRAQDVDVRRA